MTNDLSGILFVDLISISQGPGGLNWRDSGVSRTARAALMTAGVKNEVTPCTANSQADKNTQAHMKLYNKIKSILKVQSQ